LWGEPAHDACQRLLLAAQRAVGVGGTRPAPAFPRRGKRERGRSDSLLPQAIFRRCRLVGICPGWWRILLFLQRFKAIWIRSPHSIWKWLSACFQPCTVSHFWMTFRSAR
jgi:hypothetical protein